jgi:Gdp/GTP exchange factor required for growth at low temperatures
LRDLAINFELPTFLDPSSPSNAASIDPETGALLTLSDPSAFDKLPPLPSNIQMMPLVNVHKFRVMANVIRRVLVFKELVEVYPFEADSELYLSCLKLRSLSMEKMRECSKICEPSK